jgi:predicted nucleotidyltransferase
VDIAYDVLGQASLWDLGGLLMELQEALGRKVDLIDREMMKPERRAFMERTLVPL